jgi:hypothetical protein
VGGVLLACAAAGCGFDDQFLGFHFDIPTMTRDPINDTNPQGTPTHGDHEPNVVRSRAIWWSGAALVAVIVLVGGLMEGLVAIFERQVPHVAIESSVRPAAPMEAGSAPITPDRQALLVKLRSEERAALSEYRWIDRERGVARIPIERAMEIVAESGLPTSIGETKSGGGAK